MCQNRAGKAEIGCLATAQECAIEAKIPWGIIRDCAGPDADGVDAEGAKLLLDNVGDTIDRGIS